MEARGSEVWYVDITLETPLLSPIAALASILCSLVPWPPLTLEYPDLLDLFCLFLCSSSSWPYLRYLRISLLNAHISKIGIIVEQLYCILRKNTRAKGCKGLSTVSPGRCSIYLQRKSLEPQVNPIWSCDFDAINMLVMSNLGPLWLILFMTWEVCIKLTETVIESLGSPCKPLCPESF